MQFKATCAAFINSDIRLAQQQGHSRDNIVAGLVYAIAANYLNRVKGPRSVGKKVFLQGGVALNRAVGHAFAHSVGRPGRDPAQPGIARRARGRRCWPWNDPHGGRPGRGDRSADAGRAGDEARSAGSPAGPARLYCSIDRFEVAGRRFPFGGRCSLYENVWKRKAAHRGRRAGPGEQRGAEIALLGDPAGATAALGERPAAPGTHRHSAGADDALAVIRSTRPSFPAWAWRWCCPRWTRGAN